MRGALIGRLTAKAKNRWNQSTEIQRDLWRLGFALGVFALVAAAGVTAGRPLWRHWRHGRALVQAADFERIHDNRNALLAMRTAINLAPQDRATREAAAALLSRIGSPEAVDLREQIVRMAPDDQAARLAFAREALRFGETLRAQTALGMIREPARGLAYHRLAAMLASALGQTAEAKAQLAAVLTDDPSDVDAKLDFATLLARSDDAVEVAAGVAGLETLVQVQATRVRATVELLKAATRGRDPAVLGTRVQWLRKALNGGAAPPTGSAEDAWISLVEQVKTMANTPGDAALLARWVGRLGQGREMVVWLESLPSGLRDAEEVRAVAAELSAELPDLPRLRALLAAGAWGDIPAAALDQVIDFRQAAGGGEVAGGIPEEVWGKAAAACGDSAQGMRVLTRLALVWKNDEGAEVVLEKAQERFPRDFWACEQLRTLYARQKNADRLLRLYQRWSRLMPEDAGLAASWVTLSAVLDSGDAQVVTRAAELYAAGPLVPANAVAQAAIWWRVKNFQAALKALEALPVEEARKPAVAFWLGLVQAEIGMREVAQVSLKLVDVKAILPEEKMFWTAAVAKVESLSSSAPQAEKPVEQVKKSSNGL
ncbi:MAG: hypothetical protein WC661_03065 [Opitutaceae bacterium]|jgi:tetratricopeptide (TPR) repeat protein